MAGSGEGWSATEAFASGPGAETEEGASGETASDTTPMRSACLQGSEGLQVLVFRTCVHRLGLRASLPEFRQGVVP